MIESFKLEDIIDIDAFQKIQDDISKATEISIITVDYKGTPVTKHSGCSEFCNLIRKNEKYKGLCERCDSRGGLEAARLKEPYIYICHQGLIDFASPIIIDDQYVGAVMAGQIRIEDVQTLDLEAIIPNKFDLDYLEYYYKLPIVSFEKVQSIAQMMFHISNYIVKEGLLKLRKQEMYEKINPKMIFNILESITSMAEIEGAHKTQEAISNLDKVLKHTFKENFNYEEVNSILEDTKGIDYNSSIEINPIQTALNYIDSNLNENISLEKTALICNLSPSYFSKLFKKEVGVNFITYINSKKIEKAKDLLVNTNIPISNIAIDLGFEDCGYFIRVFKKIEDITPKKYRDENSILKCI